GGRAGPRGNRGRRRRRGRGLQPEPRSDPADRQCRGDARPADHRRVDREPPVPTLRPQRPLPRQPAGARLVGPARPPGPAPEAGGVGRKVAAARAYRELKAEIEAAVGGPGAEGFRVGCLRPVESTEYHFPQAPFYERHGERQVAAGIYDRVLRYREHVLPIAEALSAVASGSIP